MTAIDGTPGEGAVALPLRVPLRVPLAAAELLRIRFHALHDLRRYTVPRCWAPHTQTQMHGVR